VSDRQRWEGTDPVWLRGLAAPRIGRRDLMRGAGAISLSALLAACGVKGTKQQAAPPDQVAEFWKAQTKNPPVQLRELAAVHRPGDLRGQDHPPHPGRFHQADRDEGEL
jgi:hypothetical protein